MFIFYILTAIVSASVGLCAMSIHPKPFMPRGAINAPQVAPQAAITTDFTVRSCKKFLAGDKFFKNSTSGIDLDPLKQKVLNDDVMIEELWDLVALQNILESGSVQQKKLVDPLDGRKLHNAFKKILVTEESERPTLGLADDPEWDHPESLGRHMRELVTVMSDSYHKIHEDNSTSMSNVIDSYELLSSAFDKFAACLYILRKHERKQLFPFYKRLIGWAKCLVRHGGKIECEWTSEQVVSEFTEAYAEMLLKVTREKMFGSHRSIRP